MILIITKMCNHCGNAYSYIPKNQTLVLNVI